MKKLEDFLRPTQDRLFEELATMYRGKTIINDSNYILVKGQAPIMLIAHLDTVHCDPVETICENDSGNILMSPQGIGGDDRCGVYALVTAYKQSTVKPWILFTCEEEVGGVGAERFCIDHRSGLLPDEIDQFKCLIEIDRKGKDEAVYYGCDNAEFEDYIRGYGFQTDSGSFSDISLIAPELKIAAVNLSSGYYNAHTNHEYINRRHLECTIDKVIKIINDSTSKKFPQYKYIKAHYIISDTTSASWEISDIYDTYLDDENVVKKALKKLPMDIKIDYRMLLDYYTVKELEELRTEEGDYIIPLLAQTEYGDDYWEYYSYLEYCETYRY